MMQNIYYKCKKCKAWKLAEEYYFRKNDGVKDCRRGDCKRCYNMKIYDQRNRKNYLKLVNKAKIFKYQRLKKKELLDNLNQISALNKKDIYN